MLPRSTEVARFKLPETMAFQSGPVLIDGMMYVTTATNTYAIDARTGEQRWIHHFEPKSMGLGTPVRGVGYADGRLFRGTPDGHLLALGRQDRQGDLGCCRRLTRPVVSTTPSRPSCGKAASTWRTPAATLARSGTSVRSTRRAENRCGTSISCRRPDLARRPGRRTSPELVAEFTRHLRWTPRRVSSTHQPVIRDPTSSHPIALVTTFTHAASLCSMRGRVRSAAITNWSRTTSTIGTWRRAQSLFTSKAGKKMVAAAGKNGYLYGLDRELKTVLYKVPVTRIENTEAPLTTEGTRFLPGAQGGTNWYGPTYSPLMNAIYVPTIDWATTIKLAGPESLTLKPGTPFLGSSTALASRIRSRSAWDM